MASKSSVYWFGLLIAIALASCAPVAQSTPTADQKIVSTSVAATLNAVLTATQQALPSSPPPTIASPTAEPTSTVIPTPLPTFTPVSPTSPPGSQLELVAYTKYSDVHLWSPDNGVTRLTDMHDVVSVRLSDDGALVAFKRQDPEDITLQELWVVNTNGIPNPRLLVGADELAAMVPPDAGEFVLGYGVLDYAWRPATHQLAYNTVILHEGPGFGPNLDLHLVDADSLLKTTLFETGQAGMFYYSPDGSQIALSNPESISLVNADGSNMRRDVLTYPDVITYSEYSYHPHPLWAQDSSALGVAIPPHDPLGDPAPLTGMWRIPVDGSQAILLSSVPAISFAWPNNAFAPDLDLIAYSADATGAGPNQRNLHVSSPDGSGDTIYDSGESLEFTSWSPDSQHFTYVIQGGDDEGYYIGGIEDSPIQLYYDPHSVKDIKWLDGSRFVFLLNQNDQWGLHISNVDGEILALIDYMPDANPDFDVLP